MKSMTDAPRRDLGLVGTNLWRTFGQGTSETAAIADVTLHITAGEIVLLMGPSGSGKSTLLALLAGLLKPTRGEVLALGRNLWTMSEKERESFRARFCGFIFQGYNLFPSLTIREQLELVLRWVRPSVTAIDARYRVAEILETLGLSQRADALPIELSGGEKQRAAIARALLNEPVLCFADEPTSALDWTHGEQVVRLLVDTARKQGTTVLIVTHDPRLLPFGDRVISLSDGRLSNGC
jgi:putative ABC transport system ATP-binding protein